MSQSVHSKSMETLKRNKLLIVMMLSYVALLWASPHTGRSALIVAKDNILQLLMVMPIILAMTALTKAWIPESFISSRLGKDAGALGTLLAFVLGSVSAGPIYAAFPFAKALLDKGASLRNVTILLSSWAVVKVPMLANELAFLGAKFMVTRWILTLVSILLLSAGLEKLVSENDLAATAPSPDKMLSTKGRTVSQSCTGCGVCIHILPQEYDNVLQIVSGKALFQEGDIPESLYLQIKRACPRKAIS